MDACAEVCVAVFVFWPRLQGERPSLAFSEIARSGWMADATGQRFTIHAG